MSEDLDKQRMDRFARLLAKSPTNWVDNCVLWSAFAAAFPTMAQGADQRRYFLRALELLAKRGDIQLPSLEGRRWDRTFDPAIPTSVHVRRLEKARRRTWRTFPWHEKLAWVNDLVSLSHEAEQFLLRVHEGLAAHEFADVVPLKYRSLQLTGQEKRLGELAKTTLFDKGRLSLELLGCLAEVPPLAFAAVGSSPSIIIFENADSFSVARNMLRTMRDAPYGYVGFGGGNGVARSLPYLRQIEPPLEHVFYVGDLDYHGLKIATRAARAASAFNLPVVQPASELHSAMLASAKSFGQPSGWPDRTKSTPSEGNIRRVTQFLSHELRECVVPILRAKRRIPEEVLGPGELLRAWQATTRAY